MAMDKTVFTTGETMNMRKSVGVLAFVVTVKSQEEFDMFVSYMNEEYSVYQRSKYSPIDRECYFTVVHSTTRLGKEIQRVSYGMREAHFAPDKRWTFEEFCMRENIDHRLARPKLDSRVGRSPFIGECVYIKSFDEINHALGSVAPVTWSPHILSIGGYIFNRKDFDRMQGCSFQVVSSTHSSVPGQEIFTLSNGYVVLEYMVKGIKRVRTDGQPPAFPDLKITDSQIVAIEDIVKSNPDVKLVEDKRPIKFPKVL